MSEVFQLEQQLNKAKLLVEQRDAALRLSKNREFKKLILEGFCRDDCARFAQMSADPALNKDQRADALSMAQAGGHVRRFLSTMVLMGNTAEQEMNDLPDEIALARQEQDAEEAMEESANDPLNADKGGLQ